MIHYPFFQGQLNKLKISIFDAQILSGTESLELFVNLSPELTTANSVWKMDIKRSQYVFKVIVFTVPSISRTELPVDLVCSIELVNNGNLVDKRSLVNGIILSKDKYLEYFVANKMQKLRIQRHSIKVFSGSGRPDILYKDIDIEVTQKDGQLPFNKFAEDLAKYDKYKTKYKLNKFILVHDAKTVQPAVKETAMKRKDIWVLDLKSFYKYFVKIVNNESLNRNLIICKGNNGSPVRRKKYRMITEEIDLSDKNMIFGSLLKKDAPDPGLLYIRDIRPEDIIYILEVALENDDAYIGRNGFVSLLIREKKRLFQKHDWKDDTMVSALKREFWFRPAIHMGFIDGNYKITSVGEYLYKLWQAGDYIKYNKYFIYRFLVSPGIRDYVKLVRKVQKQIVREDMINVKIFKSLILDMLVEKSYVKNKEAGIRYIQSINYWFKIFDLGIWENRKGFVFNKNKIEDALSSFSPRTDKE